MPELNIQVEFMGGSELLLKDRKKVHDVVLPCEEAKSGAWTIGQLLRWIKETMLGDKAEMLIQDGTVRPGVLVLINEIDWELENRQNYVIRPNDKITFISTLHGG
uniref:Ubiquitin-related modifier 1 homolog n=1 Tax=Trichuris muris TaxID=70415 RepID=A0A5S6QJT9_TRIMR